VDALTIGSGADTDVSLTFDANSADGVITWMEDEDYFKFSDEILMNSTEKILFGDTATFIHQSSDGVMTVDGEATIDLNASTAVLVSNDLKLNSDSAVLGFGADNDTTLTHTDGTGLTLNSTNKLTFGDTGTFIHQSSDGVLTITSDTTVDINGAVAFDGAITGATNITLSGELDAATLDLSSSADIAGDLVLSGGADGALQFTNAGENSIKIPDNQASALIIEEANNAYITFVTTNSSEAITVAKATTFSVAATLATGSTIGNLTLANGSITDSGGALDFGNETLTTTGAVDFGAATVDSLSVSDANITNVGDIALDSISADGTDINVAVSDNSATALTIKQGSDAYLIVDTANSSESVSIGTGISGTAITLGHSTSETTVADNLTVTGTVTVGSDGSGTDVIFYSGTSGDNVTWDASEEVLQITGTNGATSLDVLDGDVRIVDKLYFYDRGGEYMSSDGSTLAIVGNTSIAGDVTITGTTPLLTIGDNADEDTGLIFAGHDGSSNVNYHMGFDAGTNNLVIGTGSTFGSDRGISLDTSGNMVLGDQLAPVDYIHVYVRDGWTSGGSGGIAAQFAIGGDVTTHANDTNYAAHFIAGSNVGATITTGGNVTAGSSAVLATMYLTEPNISTGHTVDHSATLYIQGQATEATLDYSLWVDEGVVRMDGAVSLGTDHGSDGEQLTSGGAGAACDWTAASSLREYKNVGEQASPQAALEAMLNTPAYHFHYKEKKGTGDTNTEYVGVMADDAPWAMHYKGTIVNPVNSLGYTVLSVQALNNKIEKLERELEALRS